MRVHSALELVGRSCSGRRCARRTLTGPGPYAIEHLASSVVPMAPLLDVDDLADAARPGPRGRALGMGRRGRGGRGRDRGARRAARRRRARSARIDLADLMDLQQTRPTVQLVDGVSREIAWPSIDFVAGQRRSRRRAVQRARAVAAVARGPRRDRRRRDAARRDRRRSPLGGIPSMASHRRPVEVLATGTSEDLVAEVGRVAQRLHRPDRRAERAPGDARRGRHSHGRAVGAGAALRGGGRVAAGDPGGARRGCASSAGSSVDLTTLDEQARGLRRSASRRASPTVPTSSRRSRRSSRPPTRDRAAAAERRRAGVGDRAVPPRPAS